MDGKTVGTFPERHSRIPREAGTHDVRGPEPGLTQREPQAAPYLNAAGAREGARWRARDAGAQGAGIFLGEGRSEGQPGP